MSTYRIFFRKRALSLEPELHRPDLVRQLIKSVKIQDGAFALLNTKSFMISIVLSCFLSQPSSPPEEEDDVVVVCPHCHYASIMVLICSDLIACSYLDERILGGSSAFYSETEMLTPTSIEQ